MRAVDKKASSSHRHSGRECRVMRVLTPEMYMGMRFQRQRFVRSTAHSGILAEANVGSPISTLITNINSHVTQHTVNLSTYVYTYMWVTG